jgi:hypothetical protein
MSREKTVKYLKNKKFGVTFTKTDVGRVIIIDQHKRTHPIITVITRARLVKAGWEQGGWKEGGRREGDEGRGEG